MLYKSFLILIYSELVSWKNGNISGKIMEKSWNLIPEFGWKPCYQHLTVSMSVCLLVSAPDCQYECLSVTIST